MPTDTGAARFWSDLSSLLTDEGRDDLIRTDQLLRRLIERRYDDLIADYDSGQGHRLEVVAEFVSDYAEAAGREPVLRRPVEQDPRFGLLGRILIAYASMARSPLAKVAPVEVRFAEQSSDAILNGEPPGGRLEVSLDHRIPLKTLFSELRGLWPELRARSWVRRSRRIDQRGLVLIEFVCFQTKITDSWRDRLKSWNDSFPEWRYSDVRAFQSDFRRREQQLLGERFGLEWFYNPFARLTWDELSELATAGSKPAAEIRARRYNRAFAHAPIPSGALRVAPKGSRMEILSGNQQEDEGGSSDG